MEVVRMTKQEAIKILENTRYQVGLPNCQGNKWSANADTIAIDLAIQALKDSENAVWIPVTERLPKDGTYQTYLCTLDGELCGLDEPFTGMCGIEDGKWDEEDSVIAWMPMPEPYKQDN